jgi:hypothetical protein
VTDSWRLKFDRAHEHIVDFEIKIGRYALDNPYRGERVPTRKPSRQSEYLDLSPQDHKAARRAGRTQFRRRHPQPLAHELSHLILRHETRTIEVIAGRSMFTCNPEQEEEANWLAGCLLLPRPLLVSAARLGLSMTEVARRHGVSEPMARFRMNASGAMLQASRGRGPRLARPVIRSSESDAGS